jgi:type III pantothenate kinase
MNYPPEKNSNCEKTPLVLAAEVGNSRIKIGLFESAGQGVLPKCLADWAVSLSQPAELDEVWTAIDGEGRKIGKSVIAGSNPAGVDWLLEVWPRTAAAAPQVLSDARMLPLKVQVESPEKVGFDRLLNAVAANVLRPSAAAAVIVDCGTATTVDYVSAAGVFEGGAILAGMELSARALHEHTALLPLISPQELHGDTLGGRVLRALGKNTRDALRSGLLHGHVGAVLRILSLFEEELPAPGIILVTGGSGELLLPFFDAFFDGRVRFERALSLKGLVCASS